jgi:hypothetical protein
VRAVTLRPAPCARNARLPVSAPGFEQHVSRLVVQAEHVQVVRQAAGRGEGLAMVCGERPAIEVVGVPEERWAVHGTPRACR